MYKDSPFCKSIMNMHYQKLLRKQSQSILMMNFQGWQSRNAATVENSVLKNRKGYFTLTHLFPNSNLIKAVKEEKVSTTKECYLLFSTSVFCDLVIFVIPATEKLRNLILTIQIPVIIWINSFLHLRCWRWINLRPEREASNSHFKDTWLEEYV